MNATTWPMLNRVFPLFQATLLLLLVLMTNAAAQRGNAQDAPENPENAENADGARSPGNERATTIIVQAPAELPEPPVFYTARAIAAVQVGPAHIEQKIELTVKVIQGEARTLSFGLNGDGTVIDVQDPLVKSWSIRKEGNSRFLDLHLNEDVTELSPVILLRTDDLQLPDVIELMHLTSGESVAFDSVITIQYDPGVEGGKT